MWTRTDKIVVTLGFLITLAGISTSAGGLMWLSDHPGASDEVEGWLAVVIAYGIGMIFGGMILVFNRIAQGIPD